MSAGNRHLAAFPVECATLSEMGAPHKGLGCVGLVALSCVVALGCGRRGDDGSIQADPETAVAAPALPPASPSPPASPLGDVAASPSENPLAMSLKHDGPAPVATAPSADPCAIKEPTGPLAMGLRHDRPIAPGARNPLCMRLK